MRTEEALSRKDKGEKPICDHQCTCLRPQLPIIFDRHVSPFLELEGGVDSELFAGAFPERLRPFGLTWVLLLLEIFVTL